jgi:hypothetical protein
MRRREMMLDAVGGIILFLLDVFGSIEKKEVHKRKK